MPARRKRRSSAAAAPDDCSGQQSKRPQQSLPAAFAQLSSAVFRLCVVPYLQLPELFELRHVSAAFTAMCDAATLEWMQRAFASIVQHRTLLAQPSPQKEEQRSQLRTQRVEQLRRTATPPATAAAAVFTFTLSDARFVRSQMQLLGVAGGSLSARRLTHSEIIEHFRIFPGSTRMARHIGGHRSISTCSLQELLEALFTSYEHAEAYARWRQKDAAKEERAPARYPIRTRREEGSTASTAAETRWRSSSNGRPLLLLLPEVLITCAVLDFLEFSQLMDMRAVCSSLKAVCEREAVLWMAATFPTALAFMDWKQEESYDGDEEEKEEKRELKAAQTSRSATSSSSSYSHFSFANWASLSGTNRRLPAAAAESSAVSPSSLSPVSSSPSSSSSSSSSPAVSRRPAASFTVADCVWLRRQLYRAECLKANEWWRRYGFDLSSTTQRRFIRLPLSLNRVEAQDWLNVGTSELAAHGVQPMVQYRSRERRYDVLDVLNVALTRHGHAANFTADERKRRRRRAATEAQLRRTAMRQTVDAALAAEGLQAEWGLDSDPKHSWFCQQAEFELRNGRWRRKQKRQSLVQGSPQLHRVLLALGMHCFGHCEWGGCWQGPDKTVELE